MAFMKVDKGKVGKRSSVERLYLMEIAVPDLGVVYKIGKASGHSCKDRMLQIIGSMFDLYRETPIIRVVRDRECDDVFSVETRCHRRLKDSQVKLDKKFSGCTECFVISKEEAIAVYEEELGVPKS